MWTEGSFDSINLLSMDFVVVAGAVIQHGVVVADQVLAVDQRHDVQAEPRVPGAPQGIRGGASRPIKTDGSRGRVLGYHENRHRGKWIGGRDHRRVGTAVDEDRAARVD